MMTLLKMDENTKRLIIILLLLVIIVLAIFGYTGLLVRKIMQLQGEKIHGQVYSVLKAEVINNPKDFNKYARKKNIRMLLKQSKIPLLIFIGAWLVLLIYCATMNKWNVNVFDHVKEGFGTILYIPDWDSAPRADFFGITIISGWPAWLNTPHWEWEAWGSYLFVPGVFGSGLWILYNAQRYISRSIEIWKISHDYYNPKIKGHNESQPSNNNSSIL